jgi:AraC-like DNA-binding protein
VVAARVGYQSYSAFRRAFKAAYGQTPTDYARRFAVEA